MKIYPINYGEDYQTLVLCMGLFGALCRAFLTYMVLDWQAAHERTVLDRTHSTCREHIL